jgi:hypothetical protein
MKYTKFGDIPQFPTPNYECDVGWKYLPEHMKRWIEEDGLNLDPDFQRGHVWTKAQQIAFVEYQLLGGESGKNLYFNHPNWMGSFRTSDTEQFAIVDGKQRLTAVLAFMNNEIPAFESYCREYTDNLRMVRSSFRVRVASLKKRSDILQWYININAGGTPHKKSEIDRVRKLLDEALEKESRQA